MDMPMPRKMLIRPAHGWPGKTLFLPLLFALSHTTLVDRTFPRFLRFGLFPFTSLRLWLAKPLALQPSEIALWTPF
ncbi:hypothetical protein EDB86DRAFT_2911981 [Lactarius hatsudake]|nr:hypothetical protein EDB86DRAFT_2911981 [Lactarius hatsudake]